MDLQEFLSTVITVPEGYFCLASRIDGVWSEQFYEWPTQLPEITATANTIKTVGDVYFSSYLFDQRSSKKVHVIKSSHVTIQCDLDNADPFHLQFEPSILVQTSESRYQSYWCLSEEHYDIEALSRKLTYSILDADRSGWPIGHKMRLPNTYNYKYGDPQPVIIIPNKVRLWQPAELDILPDVQHAVAVTDLQFIKSGLTVPTLSIGPNELLETIKGDLPSKIYSTYNVPAKDRSASLWALMCAAFRAGLDREHVFYLAYHSANNKWPNAPQQLSKDVLRAEVVANDLTFDARELVNNARKTPGTPQEKYRAIAGTVQGLMNQTGRFVRTDRGAIFINKNNGHPINLSRGSEQLQTYLGSIFGLNPTEKEQQFTSSQLTIYGRSITAATEVSTISYYDPRAETMLLHTGRKDVIRITANSIEVVPNGSGVVFNWIDDVDPFFPAYTNSSEQLDWGDIIFHMENLIDITLSEFLAIMRAWFLFILFRNAASARPILATIGQPGSGKTTTAKKVYAMLYGQRKKIHALGKQEDFDNAVSNQPFVFFDNVDTYVPWLADHFAQSAGAIDASKKKLYTDNDQFIIKRDALIAVTSFNPRYLRPDVVDRLILINLRRYEDENFAKEDALVYKVTKMRNLMWGAIVQDIQTILRTPQPTPQLHMRISDFVALGEWFTTALGCHSEFVSGMTKIRATQKSTDLEEDQMLVSALINYSERSKHATEFRTPGAIWTELVLFADEAITFQRMYRNAGNLSKKLAVLQDALKSILTVEWQQGAIKMWRICGREEVVSD